MEKVKLGNTDIMVSKLCLGCMSFGNKDNDPGNWMLNYEDSEALIKKALDLGINFFDTANVYSNGVSEEFVGKILKKYAKREDVVIASKVYFNEGNLSKEAILREIEGTLKRLDTDYLDLYIIHRFDYNTPIEETMETLDSLVKSGKVRALGASAMYGYQFQMMQNVALKNGWTPFVSMQNHYNMLYREDEREMVPYCKLTNVSLTPYSPLAAGRLSRTQWHANTKRTETDAIAIRKYDSTEAMDRKIVERVHELADKYGVTMTQISLAWLFSKGVTAPIVGITKMHYLDDAVGALDVKLTDEDVSYLDELYIPHKVMGAISPEGK
ncbi:oxidoreductase [Erysipelothrix larvae]|uniref:Oxidoreductase n=1 Tax=Erysipelothrix larvae TaxID=1514105 RepID=A0A0X8GYV6_9FIRM|nr:aldo/keto reductase [Erysipelothrix larvae]AMC92789.1 oxidoreductase [Erysipelothrix larvae]